MKLFKGKKTEEAKQTESFDIVSNGDEVAVIPSKAKKIRIENRNNQLFFRVHGELSNPEVSIICLEPNKLVIYKDGVSSGVLNSGKHELYSPDELKKRFLSRKKKLKEEILVDLVIYNPDLTYDVLWGTPDPIPFRDPETAIPVEFRGRGKFEIQILDVEKFHKTLVGNDANFNMIAFQKRVRSYVLQEIRHEFANIVTNLHLGYIDITTHEKEIAEAVLEDLDNKLQNEYGLRVPQFAIDEFNIDPAKRAEIEKFLRDNRDESKYKRDAKELAAEIERLDDKQWEREKYLIGLRREDYAKYLEVIKILGLNKNQQAAPAPQAGNRFCPKCGSSLEGDSNFCPKCGYQLKSIDRVCRHCGKPIKSKGKFCPHCGKEL